MGLFGGLFRRKKDNVDIHMDSHVDSHMDIHTKPKKDYHKKKGVYLRLDHNVHKEYVQKCKQYGYSVSMAVEKHMRDDLRSLFDRNFKKVAKTVQHG